MKRTTTSKTPPRRHLAAADLAAATAGRPVEDGTPLPAIRKEGTLPIANGTPLPA